MIFAAGLGTRLKPLTDTLPKALVRVGGRTLLDRVLDKCKAAGLTEAVVNVHHFPEQIVRHVSQRRDPDFPVRISDESACLLETGGALRHARALLDGDGPFLVHNVDILSDLDLGWFCAQGRPDALATLLVSERRSASGRYFLFDASGRLCGWIHEGTGEVKTPLRDADVSAWRRLSFAGVYLISPEIFRLFDEVDAHPADYPLFDAEGRLVPGSDQLLGERFSTPDFFLRVCGVRRVQGTAPTALRLLDVGKLDSLAEAERLAAALD